jgi:arylsulfatase
MLVGVDGERRVPMSQPLGHEPAILTHVSSGFRAVGDRGRLTILTAASHTSLEVQMDSKPHNIVFVLTDQERFFPVHPAGLEVPGRDWLRDRGVSFSNHYIASTYCTSSRSVIYTGQHMPNTGMFDNANFPFVGSMSTDIPTVGTLLRAAGYYTAYKGKWHLAGELEPDDERDHNFSRDMERYGFSDWNPTGDVLGSPLDGFVRDNGTMVESIEWLRTKALHLRGEGRPWFLSVDLVNPHDIMYFNTDLPGEPVQDKGGLLFPTTFAPDTPSYAQTYSGIVPDNFTQDLDEEGRPPAHAEFEAARRSGSAGYLRNRTAGNASTTTTSTASRRSTGRSPGSSRNWKISGSSTTR